ncbi:MAG: photosystem II stability/assembly factor-like uncharacterized protein [Glaciecola sp.]|jgi:photosystem II stability/assembly factor-like uncharacterized protein
MNKVLYLFFFLLPVVVSAQDGWEEQASGITDNINSLYFFDTNTGFAAGKDGNLLKTTDGGTTWSASPITSTSDFKKIHFRNSTDGFLLSEDGNLYTSVNSGSTWSVQSLDLHGLNGISFNGENGVIVGDDGNVFTSSDGGTNWKRQSPLGVWIMNDVLFFDDSTVVAIGAHGELHLSTNKGVSWSIVSTSTTATLSSLDKMNSSTVLICGEEGTVIEYEPINSVLKAVAVGYTDNSWLKSVSCQKDDVCYIVGTKSTVLIKNIDTWVFKPLDDNVNLNAVHFLNDATGYVVGITGVIYRHNGGGYPNSILEIKQPGISIFPNPVTNSLTVTHSLEGNAMVRVYNNVGAVVFNTVTSDTSNIIDTSMLPSGVYVLQLRSGQSIVTKKFIKR